MASEFVDHEAEESDNEGDAGHSKPKKRKMVLSSDEEDEEDEEDAKIAEELKGFVVNEDDGDDSEGENKEGDDSDKTDSDDDEISDEELELLKENIGMDIGKQKHQRRRIQQDSDSEGEGGSGGEPDHEADRDRVAQELFDRDDGHESGSGDEERSGRGSPAADSMRGGHREHHGADEGSGSEEEDEDDEDGDGGRLDNWIVDDDAGAGRRRKAKKSKGSTRLGIPESSLDEARDIFGVDFNIDEFYGEEAESDEEEEDLADDEFDEEEEVENEDGEMVPRTRARKSRKPPKKSLLDAIEPAELERGFLGEQDKKIQLEDKPERFLTRSLPVTEADDLEIAEEAEWIYRYAFNAMSTTRQEDADANGELIEPVQTKPYSTVGKIREALKFMRNELYEVPFIAFYRKEYVEPEMVITDLWKVFFWDEKWCDLKARKSNFVNLYQRMQTYINDMILAEANGEQIMGERPITDLRPLEESDIDRVRSCESQEAYEDLYSHFLLYYGREISRMVTYERRKQEAELGEPQSDTQLKQATRRDDYSICLKAGLNGFAEKFGLTPAQFGENLRDNYARHEVDQYPYEPLELANDFVCNQFKTPEDAIKGARYMVALQLSREPLVRHVVREEYYKRAKISVKPTLKGRKEIDENHPIYTRKYLRDKPVSDLVRDEYLLLVQAEEAELVKLTMSVDSEPSTDDENPYTFFDEIKARQVYYKDEFSRNVELWNELRKEALGSCLNDMLYPHFAKELRAKLLREAREGVVKACGQKLYDMLKVGPYVVEEEGDDEDSFKHGLKVMGIAYLSERDQAAFGAIVDGDGEVTDWVRFPHLNKRKNSFRNDDKRLKEQELERVKKFIADKRPHVIVLAAESREALMIKEDIEFCIQELEADGQISRRISVELLDNEVAKVYQDSKRAQQDFRDYPALLRQAISLARRLQDPLIELCGLVNPDEEILCLRFHPLQDLVAKEELFQTVMLEFINRVNEIGVDINRCLEHPHVAPMLQFVCGLGPRKASALLKILKQNDNKLDVRTKLVTVCHMGPKVFMNCAGFIKIDTDRFENLADEDTYVEVLDGSRVHPETYEWARKMAVDALEYEENEEVNPSQALSEILKSPDKLKDLDLDAFAEELERQGFGNKSITLYDIRAELNHRYKDLRPPYRPPSKEEVFNLLTKETPATFNVGKLVQGRVLGIAHRKPPAEGTQEYQPKRDDVTDMWVCQICLQNDFAELSEVWAHFDNKLCPGQSTGVRVRLENGILGFIPLKYLSDKPVRKPEDRVVVDMPVYCRVLKVDIDRFTAELSSRTQDLTDNESQFRPPKDLYYDYGWEVQDKENDEKRIKAKTQEGHRYLTRVIAHPHFHNVTYVDAVKLLENADQGEVVIRPSSVGHNNLTLTWKVTENITQNVNIVEKDKLNSYSLGAKLMIGEDCFEDLDEIIARYIQPMAALVRDVLGFKYYVDSGGGKRELIEGKLHQEFLKNSTKIPYSLSATADYPGKFLLSYLPPKTSSVRHEFVTVTPDGFRYRQQIFDNLGRLVRWFKEHFRDPIPRVETPRGTPRGDHTSTYTGGAGSTHSRTPMVMGTPNPQQPAYPSTPGGTAYNQPQRTPTYRAGGTPTYQGSIAAAVGAHGTPFIPGSQSMGPPIAPGTPHSGGYRTPQSSVGSSSGQGWAAIAQQQQRAASGSAAYTPGSGSSTGALTPESSPRRTPTHHQPPFQGVYNQFRPSTPRHQQQYTNYNNPNLIAHQQQQQPNMQQQQPPLAGMPWPGAGGGAIPRHQGGTPRQPNTPGTPYSPSQY